MARQTGNIAEPTTQAAEYASCQIKSLYVGRVGQEHRLPAFTHDALIGAGRNQFGQLVGACNPQYPGVSSVDDNQGAVAIDGHAIWLRQSAEPPVERTVCVEPAQQTLSIKHPETTAGIPDNTGLALSCKHPAGKHVADDAIGIDTLHGPQDCYVDTPCAVIDKCLRKKIGGVTGLHTIRRDTRHTVVVRVRNPQIASIVGQQSRVNRPSHDGIGRYGPSGIDRVNSCSARDTDQYCAILGNRYGAWGKGQRCHDRYITRRADT